MTSIHEPVPVSMAPTSCPFCRSPRIASTTAKVDASTYWRCTTCGEMWNVERLRASSNRFDPSRPWR